jgi:hypothetical protein
MKKYILLFVSALVLAGVNISCSENSLDIEQHGVKTVKAQYVDGDDNTMMQLIAAVYYQIHGDSFSDFMTGSSASAWSLRYHLENMGGDVANYFQYNTSSETKDYAKIWSYYYGVIYWCNMIIENVPNNTVASETMRNRVVAEARGIRAIMTMYLVQLYGNPPLADHILTGTEGNTPAADSWAFVEKELAAAAEALPSKTSKDGQSAIGGRLTKEACYAYLGKAQLWQKKYAEAASTLYNHVISTNLYALNPKFSELNRYTSDFCSENLWEYEFTEKSGDETAQAGLFDAVYYMWPATDVYVPDGLYGKGNQGFGYGAYSSASFGDFLKAHDTVNGARSARYVASVASYEELLDGTTGLTYNEKDVNGNKGMKRESDNCEGYFRIKLLPRDENVVGGTYYYAFQYLSNNFVYLRYAEVLLDYAEAVAMGGTSGSGLSGLQTLNLVRERAGLTDAPSLDMDNVTYGVKAERRAELYYEGSRFIDLVRWGDASKVLAKCGTYTVKFYGYQNGANTTVQSEDQWKVTKTATSATSGFVSGKDELFPIPASDVNTNKNLVQNPGW